MKKEKKQNILTVIIIIAIVALILIIGATIYSDKINEKQTENTVSPVIEESDNNTNTIEPEEIEDDEKEQEEEYIGQEENESMQEQDTQMTKDEQAIQLAKKTWGDDDTVTFSIEEKKDNIYYIAVKSNATVISWYEVNTEDWTISEFY